MEKYKKLIYFFLAAAIVVLLSFLFLKYILGIILPFLISFFVVSMVRPVIDKICAKTRASRTFVTMFVLLAVTTLVITGLVLLTVAVANQIGNIFDSVVESLSREDNYVVRFLDLIERVEEKIPILSKFTSTSVRALVTDMITEGIKSLSIGVTAKIASFIAALPQIMLTVIVIFLSLFYFAKDYDKIGKWLMECMPLSFRKKVPQIKNDVILVVSKFVKSYLLLMFLTFAMLFSGFLMLGIENSLTLALIIALVDILPILGVGTVLCPWAVIMIVNGQTEQGTGLLVLFGAIYLVRQYAEPRIVSAQMDVHPLIVLFAMYAGLKLAGILGLIFAPLIVFIIKTVRLSLKKEKTVDTRSEVC